MLPCVCRRAKRHILLTSYKCFSRMLRAIQLEIENGAELFWTESCLKELPEKAA
jgi:hypothetical protein